MLSKSFMCNVTVDYNVVGENWFCRILNYISGTLYQNDKLIRSINLTRMSNVYFLRCKLQIDTASNLHYLSVLFYQNDKRIKICIFPITMYAILWILLCVITECLMYALTTQNIRLQQSFFCWISHLVRWAIDTLSHGTVHDSFHRLIIWRMVMLSC